MICFLCKNVFPSAEILYTHFKKYHMLKSDNEYCCLENQCGQTFSNIKGFKKHVQNVRKDVENNRQNPETIPSQSSMQINQVLSGTNQRKASNENVIEANSNFNLLKLSSEEKYEKPFEKHVLDFVLGLHDKTNFNMKDVCDIIHNVKDILIEPMVSMIESFAVKIINKADPQMKIFLDSFTEPLQKFTSIHRTTAYLKKENLLTDLKHHTINDEVVEVSHGGTTTYDANNSRGILIPMSFHIKCLFEQKFNLQKCLQDVKTFKAQYLRKLLVLFKGRCGNKKLNTFREKM